MSPEAAASGLYHAAMPVTFEKHVLPNGLTLLAETDPDAHTAAVGFFVRTGGAATQPAGPATGGGSMAGSGSMGGTVAAGGAPGFERNFYLTFRECSREARMVFEPYLMVFEGYITHRATKCGGTRCDVEYKSSISPDKLRRNLEKMLWHSNNNGRIGVDGMEYRVTCVPQRKTHPTQLDPAEW